jgi:hypothetical protein
MVLPAFKSLRWQMFALPNDHSKHFDTIEARNVDQPTMPGVPRGHFVFEAPGLKHPTIRLKPQAKG